MVRFGRSARSHALCHSQGEVVYTYVGDIIVSVNPFKNVGAVGRGIRAKYKNGKADKLPPHIYALVDATYSEVC